MTRFLPPPKLLAVALLAALPMLSAMASPQSSPPSRERPAQNSRSGLSESVRRIERDTRGEVLSAERVQYDGRDMHRVKVVDDQGRVRVFMQDPPRRTQGNGNGARPSREPAPRPQSTRDDDD